MKQETAARAAKWWTDFLRNGAPLDNGDQSLTGALTMLLALEAQAAIAESITPEQIDKFESELSTLIMGNELGCSLGVDYHPGPFLRQAARQAEINLDGPMLPWKTRMQISGDTIKVSQGYGASPRILPS